MSYTTKQIDQIAKQVGLPVYHDYAFLFRAVQGSSKKSGNSVLARKWILQTNSFFEKLHRDFVQDAIKKQHPSKHTTQKREEEASSLSSEDELAFSLQTAT